MAKGNPLSCLKGKRDLISGHTLGQESSILLVQQNMKLEVVLCMRKPEYRHMSFQSHWRFLLAMNKTTEHSLGTMQLNEGFPGQHI